MKLRPTIPILIITCLMQITAKAQTENAAIRKGNQLYKQGQYEKALPEYEKAASDNPKNPVTHYNLGSVQFRRNDFATSEKEFDETITNSEDPALKQKAFYNKGVSLSKQKKLLESIEAYKTALKMNAADEDARINLQKALEELRKQQKNNQQQQEQQQPKQQEKPKPQQSKLDKKKIEQYLKSLQQKEQEVQQKMQQNRARAASQPDKDW